MSEPGEVLVFDTGPLSHFARSEWLGVLKAVVGKRRAIVPDAVVDELKVGAVKDTRIEAVLDADWIERRELRSPAELRSFAKFAQRLVSGGRNVGEAAVLTLADTMPGVAVIDDGAGRRAASDSKVELCPTLALLSEAVQGGLLTVPLVSELADDLIATKYRLPFERGGFARWAAQVGFL